MSPYKFFKIYMAVKLHFTTSYDIFKYGGKSHTIKRETFEDRPDRHKFVWLGERFHSDDHALRFCVFNFAERDDWLFMQFIELNDVYLRHEAFYSAFNVNFKKDYDYINDIKRGKGLSFHDLTSRTRSGNKAPLLQLLLQGFVSLEFVSILDARYAFSDKWLSENSLDPLVQDAVKRIKKYEPFIKNFKR